MSKIGSITQGTLDKDVAAAALDHNKSDPLAAILWLTKPQGGVTTPIKGAVKLLIEKMGEGAQEQELYALLAQGANDKVALECAYQDFTFWAAESQRT